MYEMSPFDKLKSILSEWQSSRDYHLPRGLQFIGMLDPDYPSIFWQLPQPPLGLFLQGKMPSGPYVSVIGSRKPTSYSLRMTRRCVRRWVEKKYSIVSGGAYGIDGEAHKACLDFEGAAVCILGSGFSHLYPQKHIGLFELIRERGALLSEYPPHTAPQKYFFPERNRLIAALGDELFLAQAHAKSGSLSTARASLELGRDIYVLRPPPGDENFEGSQELIEMGARSLIDPSQLEFEAQSKFILKSEFQEKNSVTVPQGSSLNQGISPQSLHS